MSIFLHALNLTRQLKNLRIFELLIIFSPLINQPTRETKSSNTIKDHIYCNIPCPFDMCDVGILRPYISDHNAIFCILNNITLNKRACTPVLNAPFQIKTFLNLKTNAKRIMGK